MASNGGPPARKMEKWPTVDQGQFLLIRVRCGLRAVCTAGSTKSTFGELRFAKLFSEIPEAHTRGKTSISLARTLAGSLGQSYDECDEQQGSCAFGKRKKRPRLTRTSELKKFNKRLTKGRVIVALPFSFISFGNH